MDEEWQDQLRRAIGSRDQLEERLELTADERRGLDLVASDARLLPLLVTPYYLSLIDPADAADPIRRQCVPSAREADRRPELDDDPLAEARYEVAPGLVRRYPDRALLIATTRCAAHCRHCTRRRLVGRGGLRSLSELEPALRWLEAHEEVREVLVSGGDPLIAPDGWIDALLGRIRSIGRIDVVRIGTRAPVTLPQRVTAGLCRVLRRWAPLYVVTHFNHPRELTPEARAACEALADAGVPLANQAVLLRGVNDCSRVQIELCRALLRARVRPYYLMQCDAVQGTAHLRTSVRRGVAIAETVRASISGLGVPTYVLDLPGGAGKVPLRPGACGERRGGALVFTGPGGELVRYEHGDDDGPCADCLCRPARDGPSKPKDLIELGSHRGLDSEQHGR